MEHRAPIVPSDARTLVEHGIELTVEDSPQRLFALSDYTDAGCTIKPAGSWVEASHEHYVIGLKELPALPAGLTQRHVFFGHAYKRQRGARTLLQRFASGGGALLDLEYLADARGRRVATFGYWAGYAGAALAILHLRRQLHGPLRALSKASLDAALTRSRDADEPRVLVIGALGRSGQGARAALATGGISPTCWGVAETRSLDRRALLAHDVLVNTVSTQHPVTPFLTPADVADPARRLAVIADVTCDVGSDFNLLPIYDSTPTGGSRSGVCATATRYWTSSPSTTSHRCSRARRAWTSRRSCCRICSRWEPRRRHGVSVCRRFTTRAPGRASRPNAPMVDRRLAHPWTHATRCSATHPASPASSSTV